MPHETTQPHYQHHVGSSSQVESFQQQFFRLSGVHPTQLFRYRDQPHMSFHQPPFNYSIFPSQQTIFCWSIKSLHNLYRDPPCAPSVYNPMSSMQYYRPTMSSQVSEIRVRTMKSKAPTMTFHLRPLLPFHLNNSHKDDHEDNEEDHPVTQLLIDDNFFNISIFLIMLTNQPLSSFCLSSHFLI